MNSITIRLIGYLLYLMSRFLQLTYRFQYFGHENRKQARGHHPQESYLAALWHQSFYPLALAHWGETFSPVVSQSKDGELIAKVFNCMGFECIRGSSTRGGAAAKNSMQTLLKKGGITAITVDGPKGPPHKVKFGIIDMAKNENALIVPFACAIDRAFIFSSWDRLKLPYPFARIVVIYGNPIHVPMAATVEDFAKWSTVVEEELNRAEKLAEQKLKELKE